MSHSPSAVARLIGCMIVGAVIGVTVGVLIDPPLGVLVGIAAAGVVFVVQGWATL